MKYRFLGEEWKDADSIDEFLDGNATPGMEDAIFEDEDGNKMKLMYYMQATYIRIDPINK